jgi:pimeloyl-ACP methyl ester carboxylesterase
MHSARVPNQIRKVQGLAVHVFGDGPGLVLLHANGGDHREFDEVIPALSRTRTVYAIDWPSHSDSDPADDLTAVALAELLPSVLDELGGDPFALIGNSVGGFAALRTAITSPDLVSRLVLVNPGGFTPRTPFSLVTCRLMGSRPVAPVAMRQLPRFYLRRSSGAVTVVRERAVDASRSWPKRRYARWRRAGAFRDFAPPCWLWCRRPRLRRPTGGAPDRARGTC